MVAVGMRALRLCGWAQREGCDAADGQQRLSWIGDGVRAGWSGFRGVGGTCRLGGGIT